MLNAFESVLTAALRSVLRLYQLTLSPLLGPSCRFAPSCSTFFREALTRHGPWQGSWLGIRRILRCHPWGAHGYDPVPPAPKA
ncbi:MAG: membrane protein insertion efficiency factor YidD [Deltaproteobacteria bacterium]